MVTLIRTLKRIKKSAPAPAQRSGSSSKTKIVTTATAQTPQNIPVNHAHHGTSYSQLQLKKTSNTAADVIRLNEKGRAKAKAPSNNTSNDSPQKASSIAIANTSHVRYAAAKSNERTIQTSTSSDRKRKSSDEEPLPKNVVREGYRYECYVDGCTNQIKNGGVCRRHGAKVTLCSSEGCTNHAKVRGVCKRHGAKVKLCSIVGCTNQTRKGGVCHRHGAQVKLCSSEGCTNQAKKGGVCIKHGAKKMVKLCRRKGNISILSV